MTATVAYPIPAGFICVRCEGSHRYCVNCGDDRCCCGESIYVVCEHDRDALKSIKKMEAEMTRVRDLISRALDRTMLPITDEDGDEIGGMVLMPASEVAECLLDKGWRWTPESERSDDTFELEREVHDRYAQIRLSFGGKGDREVPHGFTAIEAIR